MSFQDDLLTDLSDLLDPDAFGTAATYKGETVNVIFEKPVEEWSPLEGRIITTAPSAIGKTADFSAWVKDDPIVIDGVTYRIISPPEPQEVTGFCRLRLSR